MSDPSTLRERVLAAARTEHAPTRADLGRRRLVAAGGSLAWIAVLALAMHAHVPPASGVMLLAVWLAAAFVVSRLSFGGRWSWGAPRELMRMAPIAISFVVVVGAVVIGLTWGHDAPREGHHVQCLTASAAMGVVPLALTFWVERGRDPIAPASTGAALGALAGAWSGVFMSFVCGRSEVGHTIVSHVAALVILSVVSAVIGRRLLAMR